MEIITWRTIIEILLVVTIIFLTVKLLSATKFVKSTLLKSKLLDRLVSNHPINDESIICCLGKLSIEEIKVFQNKIVSYYSKNETAIDIGTCIFDIDHSGLTAYKKALLLSCLGESVRQRSPESLAIIVGRVIEIEAQDDVSDTQFETEKRRTGLQFILKVISNINDPKEFVKFFCQKLDEEVALLLKAEGIGDDQKKITEAALIKICRLVG